MEWNRSLEIGVAAVDGQHEKLVAAFKALQEAMRSGRGADRIVPTLKFLGQYAVEHFGTEEALMRAHRYPGYDAHRAEHEAFKADFARIMKDAEASTHRLATTMDVSARLLDWLFTHIGKVDRQMGAFLVEKGVR